MTFDLWRESQQSNGIRFFNMIMPFLFVFVFSHRVFRRGRHGQSETIVFGMGLAQTPAAKKRLVDGAGVYQYWDGWHLRTRYDSGHRAVTVDVKVRNPSKSAEKTMSFDGQNPAKQLGWLTHVINDRICAIFVPYYLAGSCPKVTDLDGFQRKGTWKLTPCASFYFSSFEVATNELVTMEEHAVEPIVN